VAISVTFWDKPCAIRPSSPLCPSESDLKKKKSETARDINFDLSFSFNLHVSDRWRFSARSRSKVSAPTWRRFRGCLLTPLPTPDRLLAGCCAAWKRPITRDDTITTTTKAVARLTQGRVESKRRECRRLRQMPRFFLSSRRDRIARTNRSAPSGSTFKSVVN